MTAEQKKNYVYNFGNMSVRVTISNTLMAREVAFFDELGKDINRVWATSIGLGRDEDSDDIELNIEHCNCISIS